MMLVALLSTLLQVAALHSIRFIVHHGFPAADKNTAGRCASFAHGVLVAIMLFMNHVPAAILGTMFYFVYDMLASVLFERPMPLDFKLHHLGGILLCGTTLLYGGFVKGHAAYPITLALLRMEVTNPLFQMIMIMRNDMPRIWKDWMIRAILSTVLIASWIWIRIYNISYALLETYERFQYQSFQPPQVWIGLVFGSVMLVQQILWLKKMLSSSTA